MRIKNLPSIESMDGSQDALVIEQTDGSEDKSRKVSPAQIKQYVLGNSIDDIYSVMGQMGAKNLIPYPYYRESGYSSNGMTTTYDSDGVLTINKVAGEATAYFALVYYTGSPYHFKPKTKYSLTFELEDANSLSIYLVYGGTSVVLLSNKSTGKYEATFTTPDTLSGYENLAISAGATVTETNAKVKVMIRLASDTDNTYQPYAKTNKQLTEEIGDLSQTGLTGDSVAAQLGTAKVQIADVAAKYVVERRSKGSSTTIAADGYARVDIPCTKSGYTAIGILEVQGPATAGAVSLMQFSVSGDGTLIYVYFANNTSSAKTMSDVSVRVLYRKN